MGEIGARLALGAILAVAPVGLHAQAVSDSVVYAVAPGSRFEVKTSKGGLFAVFGHSHRIQARAFTGCIVYRPDDVADSRVEIRIPTDSLQVLTPSDTAEIRQVTANMRNEVLDVHQYPDIGFASSVVKPTDGGLKITGVFAMHGVQRAVTVDVKTTVAPDTLRASTSFRLKQTDFDIHPYHAALGTVSVGNDVTIILDVVAVRDPGPCRV